MIWFSIQFVEHLSVSELAFGADSLHIASEIGYPDGEIKCQNSAFCFFTYSSHLFVMLNNCCSYGFIKLITSLLIYPVCTTKAGDKILTSFYMLYYSSFQIQSIVPVEEMAYLRGVCLWKGQYFANNATWQHDCNTCTCVASAVSCTQVWCGLGNCLGHPNLTVGSVVCQSNQVSVGKL